MIELAGLKVAFVAGTLGQGGAERQLYYMVKALRNAGACPSVLSLTRGEFWEQRIAALGVEVTWIGRRSSPAARLTGLIGGLRKSKPDIVQSQHFYTNPYAAIASRFLQLPDIGAIRNDGISEMRATGALSGRLSLRLPRLLAANSRAGMRNAVALGAPESRLHFLPNVVDTDEFAPAPRDGKGPVMLLAAGRLTPQKRLDRFLSVLSDIRSRGASTCAVIAGDGPLRPVLEARAKKLGVAEAVEWLGAVPDMRPIYRRADVLVLTSDWEGTPNVVLEAMAAGLPVVASRVGGVEEIICHEKTGFLVESGDQDSMVEWIRRLVSDRELRERTGGRSREHVICEHSLAGMGSHLQGLYAKLRRAQTVSANLIDGTSSRLK